MSDEKRNKYSCSNMPLDYTFISEEPYPYPDKDTYYWHLTDIPEKYDRYKVIHAFEKTMKIWQRAIDQISPRGEYLHLAATSTKENADFIFSFGAGTHNMHFDDGRLSVCPSPFDGELGVLAHAWSKVAVKPYGGSMHCDSSEDFSEMGIRLLTVILHEIGHIFNLGHSKNEDAIMWPYNNKDKDKLRMDDKRGLAKVLGPVKKVVYELYYMEEEKKEKKEEKDSEIDPEVGNGDCLGLSSIAILFGFLMIFLV